MSTDKNGLKDILLKLNSLKSVIHLTENKVGLNTITEVIQELEVFKENLIPYIYDFAWNYGRFFHVGDAEKIIAVVKERIQLPEEFISEIKLNSDERRSRGCCSECGEGYDNEDEWLYNTECQICGHPIPEDLIITKE